MMDSSGWSTGTRVNDGLDRSLSSSYMHQKKTPPWLSLDHGLPSSPSVASHQSTFTDSPFSSASSSSFSSNGPLDYSPPLSGLDFSPLSSDASTFAHQQAQNSIFAQAQAQAVTQLQAQAAQRHQATTSPYASFEPPSAQLKQLLDLAAFIAAQYKNVTASQSAEYAHNEWSEWTQQIKANNEADMALALIAASVGEAEEKPKIKREKYKTEMCRSWEEQGQCRYGEVCQFAHGRDELRSVSRHPKYKTEPCRAFYRTGTCPYAKRCIFMHTTSADAYKMYGGGGKEEVIHKEPLLSRVGIQTAPRSSSRERSLSFNVDVVSGGDFGLGIPSSFNGLNDYLHQQNHGLSNKDEKQNYQYPRQHTADLLDHKQGRTVTI